MSTENNIILTDKELDEKINEVASHLQQAINLQEQALNKRLILQGQLEILEKIKQDRTLYDVKKESKAVEKK